MAHFPHKYSMKLTDEQKALLLQAIALSDEAWRGVSHHARQATINWARGVVSQAKAAANPKRRRKHAAAV